MLSTENLAVANYEEHFKSDAYLRSLRYGPFLISVLSATVWQDRAATVDITTISSSVVIQERTTARTFTRPHLLRIFSVSKPSSVRSRKSVVPVRPRHSWKSVSFNPLCAESELGHIQRDSRDFRDFSIALLSTISTCWFKTNLLKFTLKPVSSSRLLLASHSLFPVGNYGFRIDHDC